MPETKEKPPPKKRGRKPKGGKIIDKTDKKNNNKVIVSNIILHLKCKSSDLKNDFTNEIQYDPEIQSIEGISSNCYKPNELSYQLISSNDNTDNNTNIIDNENDNKNEKISNKTIYNKLKHIQFTLHSNNLSNKKSNCFWCTYNFDNPVIYIPKSYIDDKYNVYGNFCSPECAVAFLFNEHIDSSTKFERYNLFNHIYANIYNYEKNIKPAPNPLYILDKFMGTLSITEFRKLSSQEQLLFVMDKPMTRIFPELHDDNDEFLLNQHSNINSQKSSQNKISKNKMFINNFSKT